jgi:hypothetical protein
MLTTLLLSTVLATEPLSLADFTDASDELGDSSAGDAIDDALVESLLQDKKQQQLLLSALLCEAQQYRDGIEDRLTQDITEVLLADAARTDARIAKIKAQLGKRKPLTCGTPAVVRIVECRGLLPAPECESDDSLHAQVRATERLASR